jgi:hypothetical protein
MEWWVGSLWEGVTIKAAPILIFAYIENWIAIENFKLGILYACNWIFNWTIFYFFCEDSKLEMLYIHKTEFLSIAFKLDQM